MLICKETHITCDFPAWRIRTPYPPSGSAHGSGPTFCQAWSGSKLLAKLNSRRQKSPQAVKFSESFNPKETKNPLLLETCENQCFY